jgi:hypothetical protein
MSRKDRERQRKKQKWETEDAGIKARWQKAPQMKAALRAKGCVLPFYDFLDSYEVEFKKLVAWAKAEFRSLHDVYEVSHADLDNDSNWTRLGLPKHWQQVRFDCDGDLAASYTKRDSNANMRGSTVAFRDDTNNLHTIVEVLRNPVCGLEHCTF